MFGGYAMSGNGEEAFEHFELRKHGHMNINIITLLLSHLQYLEASPVYGTSNEEKSPEICLQTESSHHWTF
jgi:hypothetical protein